MAEMTQNVVNDGPKFEKPRPQGYKKHHRWQSGWQVWLAVVRFIDRSWPKNS